MTVHWNFWPTLTFAFVSLTWVVYVAVFSLRKKAPAARTIRKVSSWSGIVLQAAAYVPLLFLQRARFTPLLPMAKPLEITLVFCTATVATASVWIVFGAVRSLGKQWSFQARLAEGHRLVVTGPFRWVRHPIYLGMFGLTIATGLAVSHWSGLVAGAVLFAIGTVLRARSEEKLLREAFGDDFAAYARHVPAFFPRFR